MTFVRTSSSVMWKKFLCSLWKFTLSLILCGHEAGSSQEFTTSLWPQQPSWRRQREAGRRGWACCTQRGQRHDSCNVTECGKSQGVWILSKGTVCVCVLSKIPYVSVLLGLATAGGRPSVPSDNRPSCYPHTSVEMEQQSGRGEMEMYWPCGNLLQTLS